MILFRLIVLILGIMLFTISCTNDNSIDSTYNKYERSYYNNTSIYNAERELLKASIFKRDSLQYFLSKRVKGIERKSKFYNDILSSINVERRCENFNYYFSILLFDFSGNNTFIEVKNINNISQIKKIEFLSKFDNKIVSYITNIREIETSSNVVDSIEYYLYHFDFWNLNVYNMHINPDRKSLVNDFRYGKSLFFDCYKKINGIEVHHMINRSAGFPVSNGLLLSISGILPDSLKLEYD